MTPDRLTFVLRRMSQRSFADPGDASTVVTHRFRMSVDAASYTIG